MSIRVPSSLPRPPVPTSSPAAEAPRNTLGADHAAPLTAGGRADTARPERVLRRDAHAGALHGAAARQARDLVDAAKTFEQVRDLVQGDHPVPRKLWAPLYKLLPKGSADEGGWALREGPPTRDRTAAFDAAFTAVKAGETVLPPEAADFTYLVVPGFMGEQIPTYMNAHVERLRSRGLEAQQVAIETEAGVEENARMVRDAILEAAKGGRQVVLLGHSKGGLDITAALSLYPELTPLVRAVATMQTPYGGTPLASDLNALGPLRWLVGNVLERLGGSGDSMRDLTYAQRQKFLADHPYPQDIPTVSMATSESSLTSVFATTTNYMANRYGWASDGMVPTQDQIIPGSDVVHVQGVDHAEAGLDGPGPLVSHKASDLTEALIAVALQAQVPARSLPAA